jgi:hypothetical protein
VKEAADLRALERESSVIIEADGSLGKKIFSEGSWQFQSGRISELFLSVYFLAGTLFTVQMPSTFRPQMTHQFSPAMIHPQRIILPASL